MVWKKISTRSYTATWKSHNPWQEKWSVGTGSVEKKDQEIPTLIATSLAANDRPESQFVIKKIQEHNPEAQLVALIASSVASQDRPESRFVVKSIYKKINQTEDDHVTKI